MEVEDGRNIELEAFGEGSDDVKGKGGCNAKVDGDFVNENSKVKEDNNLFDKVSEINDDRQIVFLLTKEEDLIWRRMMLVMISLVHHQL